MTTPFATRLSRVRVPPAPLVSRTYNLLYFSSSRWTKTGPVLKQLVRRSGG